MDTPPPDQSPVPPPPTPPAPPSGPTPTPLIGSENPDERQWAMFCHLSGLLGHLLVGLGHLLGPLVMWLIRKDTMPFVNQEGKEALNFQISITIYGIATGAFMCIGIPLFIAVIIFDIIVVIQASIAASNGKPYRYPLCIRFIQ